VDSGFCLGKKCRIRAKEDEPGHCMIVSTPDFDGVLKVQQQVTAVSTSIERK